MNHPLPDPDAKPLGQCFTGDEPDPERLKLALVIVRALFAALAAKQAQEAAQDAA